MSWHFKVVCACNSTMTGQIDKHPATIIRIFLETHIGPEHYAEVRYGSRVSESMDELRRLAKANRKVAVR